MKKEYAFTIGAGTAVVGDAIWRSIPGTGAFAVPPESKNVLSFVEHYHWGLVSLIAASRIKKYSMFLNGIGAGMIMTEAASSTPFGYGKSAYELQGSIALASFLGGLLLISYGSK